MCLDAAPDERTMTDDYQYPVYFECDSLRDELRKKIELYFRNHRRSGGGECGPLRRVTDNVYCLAFERQEDQQRVLKTSRHEIAGCSLVLTGKSSIDLHSTRCPIAATSSQEYTKSSKSLPASTLPPSSTEHDLRPGTFPREAKAERNVGKHSEVQSNFKNREKQTRILQLGEVKLRLLWKDINQSLIQDFPKVTVSQRDSGQLEVEGSTEEILKAGDLISEMENSVLEKKVFDKSPHLVTFLEKAYGGPGVLANVLVACEEVVLELRDTHLCLFSLSDDKLDDAVKALQDEFKEVELDVPKCSAAPSELWQKLKSKTNEMNQEQCRVQAVVISDSTVCLLGHSEEVNELCEIVSQFIVDETYLEGTFPLPFSVPAQDLPELLEVHGFDYSGVTFRPLISSSEPRVVLEGPSKKVFDVRNRLGPFLDSLHQKNLLGNVRSSIQISADDALLQYHNHTTTQHLTEGIMNVASYNLPDGLQVQVCQGDITKLEADALVNAANEDLDHCGGVAAALSKAGGPEVQKESNTLVKQTGKISIGDVVVTTGGNLKCKKLLHAVGPKGGKADGRERFLLEKTTRSALDIAERTNFSSIAIPCIGSGASGITITVCSEAIVTAVNEFGSQGGRNLSKIILIDNREEVVEALHEACDRILQGKSTRNRTGTAVPDPEIGTSAGTSEGEVHVEIIEGTIETQEVDALVCPMVGHDPCSTRVGNTLFNIVGQQLIEMFRKEADEETMPGDAVLVENLTGLPSNAVFFLNLASWDEDQNGTAVEVLKLAVNNFLSACERRGFGSVALPMLGSGLVLHFPDSVVTRVLLGEINAFQNSRESRTPFLVRIMIHPDNKEFSEVLKSVQKGPTKDVYQPDDVSTTKRIVLLGKTGVGKSSLANVIFGEELFTTDDSPNSGTKVCQAETRLVREKSITLIDTPGLFDAERSEEEVKPEILSCITECSPGPHAFLILLKVEKFTELENAVISKINEYFSEDALKYAVVVFTHGEQLPKGMKIEDFVRQNKNLRNLVKKCGGRCHVVDNTYWNDKQQEDYRSNKYQVEELLNTIEKLVTENNGGYYTNKVLEVVENEIKKEEAIIKTSSGNMDLAEIRKKAKSQVSQKFWIQLAATTTGVLLGAFLGVTAMVAAFMSTVRQLKTLPLVGKVLTGVTAGEVVLGTGIALGVTAGVGGAVMGGVIGHEAADDAETIREAIEKASKAVINKGKSTLNNL